MEEEKKEKIETKLLDLKRVAHTRAGGKKLRFRAVIVAGNKAGKVGVGVASGLDVAQAIEKATFQAKKNMIEVPIANDTIPHEVYAKFGPAKVLLKPQRKGRGLVAGGTVRIICILAGIKNISSKNLGRTSNKMNVARATIEALKKLKIPSTKHQIPNKLPNSKHQTSNGKVSVI
jgi:small subunit ribosomal protein S5